MTSFISGPVLQVQLTVSTATDQSQEVANNITHWTVVDVIDIDSNNDKNIHWVRSHAFSILLDPGVVMGLSGISNFNQLKLERTSNTLTGTETWRVL
jgi:hypothetical protein